jgi:hypothetical protein
MTFDETSYLVPSVDNPNNIAVNIVEVVKAEARLGEVAIVNVHKAPELLATFNRSWLELNRIVTMLTYERNKADTARKRSKAEAVLCCNDAAIMAKGHKKASADLRDAMSELDPDVTKASEILNELEAILGFLKGKQEAFRKGFQAVKELLERGNLPKEKYGDANRPQAYSQVPQEDDEFALPNGFGTR